MRGSKRSPWLFGLGVLLAVLVVYGGHARADVTTDRSGSIIVFPKVVADGTRDTIIQMANTSNTQTTVHCTYVNAAGFCSVTTTTPCDLDSDCSTGELCVHQCLDHNFEIFLTAQQPTSWRVSAGRDSFPFGGLSVPPMFGGTSPSPFVGELKCVQVDGSGAPVGQNSLKGEATLFSVAAGQKFGQVSEYNAIAILGNGAGLSAHSNVLNLNLAGTCLAGPNIGLACSVDTQASDCPGSTCTFNALGEFNACPNSLVVNHYGDGATDSFTGADVNTELTLVPCTELLELVPTHALAQFQIFNEFENKLSASIDFDCLLNRRLSNISSQFTAGTIGSDFAKTRISPAAGSICYTGDNRCHLCTLGDTDLQCNPVGGTPLPVGALVGNCDCNAGNPCVNPIGVGTCAISGANCQNAGDCPGAGDSCTITNTFGCMPWSGLLGVAEEFQQPVGTGSVPGTAAVNVYVEGSRPGDVIVLPPVQ
ncbi:MAG: hypothetical protein ACHQ9S_16550 [Candidatus Binatia bacterium]